MALSVTKDPRASRTQDYTTNATLRCCQISRKSGNILVTGDREKQVQLFTLASGPGVPLAKGPILNLTGHASAVESVCLDWSEELVVAGASSGVIKLWDLEHAKGGCHAVA
jgi:katanin p80 WD40 repeat-containing subunit B1